MRVTGVSCPKRGGRGRCPANQSKLVSGSGGKGAVPRARLTEGCQLPGARGSGQNGLKNSGLPIGHTVVEAPRRVGRPGSGTQRGKNAASPAGCGPARQLRAGVARRVLRRAEACVSGRLDLSGSRERPAVGVRGRLGVSHSVSRDGRLSSSATNSGVPRASVRRLREGEPSLRRPRTHVCPLALKVARSRAALSPVSG